jgi:hypothetical protein
MTKALSAEPQVFLYLGNLKSVRSRTKTGKAGPKSSVTKELKVILITFLSDKCGCTTES